MSMKYHVLYQGDYIRIGPGGKRIPEPSLIFESFEGAQEALVARAKAFGEPESRYSVHCGDLPSRDDANPKKAYGDKKLPTHLVPPALILGVARNMGDGAEKYGAFNWRDKKVEVMTYVGAIQRHLAAFIDGEDVDPESKRGATHLGAIGACVGILMDAGMNGQLVDNRPPRGKAGEHIRAAAGVVLDKPSSENSSK